MFTTVLILLLLLIAGIWIYNRIVSDHNQVLAAWSDIDVQLKRRHDLVPQLVSSVQAYTRHEQATLNAVTELRTRSDVTPQLSEKAAIESALSAAVQRLVIVAEDYPDLKADENFRQLQTELTEIENHIQYARRFYNGAVKQFNTRIQTFPNFLVAQPAGYEAAEYFEIDEQKERVNPRVELG